MKVGSLFSGIGGMDLGLERAGHTVIWQSEIDPFCNGVLANHWPTIPNLGDITLIDWSEVERPDLICGGFPCQDISSAGTRHVRPGLDGARSGLWYWYWVALHDLRPHYALVENVYGNWRQWLPDIRRGLSQLGYTTRAIRLSAGAVGAPHRRERVFVVAHTDRDCEPSCTFDAQARELPDPPDFGGYWRKDLPGVLRMDDGVPRGVDRLRAIGNAVVPQCAEWVGGLLPV